MAVEYKLIFDNFTQNQMMGMDGYLEMFSGYVSHRPDPGAMNTSKHHEIIYKSSINANKLKNNLIRASKELNLQTLVSSSGRTYTVKNNTMARNRNQRKAKDNW